MQHSTGISKGFIITILWLLLPIARSFDLEHLFAFTAKHAKQAEDKVDKILSRCYGDYGCFSLGGKFVSLVRPVNLFPYAAETINPKLFLYTRKNPNTPVLLTANDVSGVNKTNFNFSMPTKFIVHGFLEAGTNVWCTSMKDELLIYDDFNVIIVDWPIGASPPYTQAVANARLVGAMLGRFLQLLQITYDYPPQLSHIIGHSLGAHVAGYAGEKLNKLGRISGLDPAGPYFENTDPIVRLDTSDAEFVDVIHTDGASILKGAFGMQTQVGHLDFFPNGGIKQPGCEDSVAEALEKEDMNLYRGISHWVACRHIRAHEYFTESINGIENCSFQSYECDNYQNFLHGQCASCGMHGNLCAKMGFHADDYRKYNNVIVPIKFFLKTNSDPPFCTNHHIVTIQTSRRSKALNDDPINGVLLLQIDGENRRIELNEFDTQERKFEPDMTYTEVVSSRMSGPLRRLHLQLMETYGGFTNQLVRIFKGEPMLGIDQVEVENLETREITEFCGGTNRLLKPGSKLTLYPRPKC